MAQPKEFYVREVRAQKDGPALVIGVPNNGSSICIGDLFVTSCLVEQTLDDILAGRPPAPPTDLVTVELTVTSISYPQADINELPSGHTGALVLDGDGAGAVKPGRLLLTCS